MEYQFAILPDGAGKKYLNRIEELNRPDYTANT